MFTRFVAVLAMFFAAISVSNARVMRAYLSRTAPCRDGFRRTNSNAMDIFYQRCGGSTVRKPIQTGVSPAKIAARWEPNLERFRSEPQR